MIITLILWTIIGPLLWVLAGFGCRKIGHVLAANPNLLYLSWFLGGPLIWLFVIVSGLIFSYLMWQENKPISQNNGYKS